MQRIRPYQATTHIISFTAAAAAVMSSVNSRPSDGDLKEQQQQRFVSLVKQRDAAAVRALLQSMSDEARRGLYHATSMGFNGVFKRWNNVR